MGLKLKGKVNSEVSTWVGNSLESPKKTVGEQWAKRRIPSSTAPLRGAHSTRPLTRCIWHCSRYLSPASHPASAKALLVLTTPHSSPIRSVLICPIRTETWDSVTYLGPQTVCSIALVNRGYDGTMMVISVDSRWIRLPFPGSSAMRLPSAARHEGLGMWGLWLGSGLRGLIGMSPTRLTEKADCWKRPSAQEASRSPPRHPESSTTTSSLRINQ